MLHQIFTVYDSKAQAYLQPFYAPTKGAAIRVFSDICNDGTHPFNRHPEDYTLFALGEFDDNNGKLLSLTTPAPIGKAIEFVQPVKKGK